MFLDLPVQDRLRITGVVAFIMTMAAIAEHIDHHVLLELLTKIEGDSRYPDRRLRIVAIDMEDRGLHPSGNVSGIGRRPRLVGQRGESDLIVDDQVDGAARPIAIELR